jgi:hypothetical protein
MGMRTSANVGHALRNIGNKPGEDSGEVLVRLNDGDEVRCDTNEVLLTDAGLILGSVDWPHRFIPMGSIKDVVNAPKGG